MALSLNVFRMFVSTVGLGIIFWLSIYFLVQNKAKFRPWYSMVFPIGRRSVFWKINTTVAEASGARQEPNARITDVFT